MYKTMLRTSISGRARIQTPTRIGSVWAKSDYGNKGLKQEKPAKNATRRNEAPLADHRIWRQQPVKTKPSLGHF
jgi:hypothetical protein